MVITFDECDHAITVLAGRFGSSVSATSAGLDRSVGASITDLGLHYRGRLHDGVLDGIERESDDAAPAQIRLAMTSEELLALAAGTVSLGSSWKAGRLKVHASFPDMLRLRGML